MIGNKKGQNNEIIIAVIVLFILYIVGRNFGWW